MQALRNGTSRYLAAHWQHCSPAVASPVLRQQLRQHDPATHHRMARFIARDASSGKVSLSADDKLAIIELCHRFDQALNRLDQPAAGALFTANAQLHHPRGVVQGAENIVAYFKSVEPMAKGNRHLTLDMVVDAGETSTRASAVSYRLLHKACMPTVLIASGTIEDEFIKEGEVWRFLARKFIMDPPAAPPAAAK